MNKKIISIALASMMTLGSLAFADTEVEVKENKAFIDGYKVEEKYEFRADDSVKRSEIAKIIATALELDLKEDTFEDVAEDHWAAKFIGALQNLGYVKGDDEGNYNPESGLTRAEMAQIISNILGEEDADDEAKDDKAKDDEAKEDEAKDDEAKDDEAKEDEAKEDEAKEDEAKDDEAKDDEAKDEDDKDDEKESKFDDIEGHWGAKAINAIADKGIVKGRAAKKFAPDEKVTRAEAVTMILRYMERNVDKEDAIENLENIFADLNEEHWAIEMILAASNDYKYVIEDDKEVIVKEEVKDEDEDEAKDDEVKDDEAKDEETVEEK